MSKQIIKKTIAVALIVLSIPFCMRWRSTVEYYFSDERKQATFLLEFSLTGTSTVEVRGQENCQGDEIIIPEKTICCGYLCTVTSIGRGAFLDWHFLKSVEIPTTVTEINESAFEGCNGLKSVKIPSSVTRIGEFAFYGCSGLTSVEIPLSVTEISEYAFYGCSGLTSVEIPSSVTEIGAGAFEGCIGLTNLEIHTSVTENEFGRIIRICNGAFKNCHNLNIVIGNFDSYIVERDAFEGCKSVTWKKDM